MSSKHIEGKTETQSFWDSDATCEMLCQSCLLTLQSEEEVTGWGGEAWKRGREGATRASLVGLVVPKTGHPGRTNFKNGNRGGTCL